MSNTFPRSYQECEEIVQYFSESNDEKEYVRAIQIDNQIAGCIGAFFESDIYCKNAEIAYWIGKDFRGKGVMPDHSNTTKVLTEHLKKQDTPMKEQ
ncbi:MAG: GNAT family N-acetyltransferase [Ruminococcus sp.]|nr:GNAT family N-acetyltransferase [Ruminococcus sp.]